MGCDFWVMAHTLTKINDNSFFFFVSKSSSPIFLDETIMTILTVFVKFLCFAIMESKSLETDVEEDFEQSLAFHGIQ